MREDFNYKIGVNIIMKITVGKSKRIMASEDYATLRGKKSIKSAVSNEQYVANSNGEDNIAKGRTLDECIKNLLRKVDAEDIIDWAIYIDKYVDGEWVESFKETDVYDMAFGISAACGKKSVKAGKILFPWAMVGRFADGYTCEVAGDSEAECVEKLGNMQDKHGELEFYSGIDDDDYDASGRRIEHGSNFRSSDDLLRDLEDDVERRTWYDSVYTSKRFCVKSSKCITVPKSKRKPVKAARSLDIYTWGELTPEQQEYVIQNWSDMRKLAEVIYEWYDDDIMFVYQEEKQYIADKYADQYGLSINPDKLYWQSNSQGPYPEWDLSQVFDEYQLNDGTEIYFYGRGLDVEAETDSWGEEVESPEIDEVVGHAQEYIDEMWGYINDVCQSYPDDEWVRDTFDANPDSVEFTVSENGEVRYF